MCLKNQVRALEPWPRTYTFWHRAHGTPLRMILGPLNVVELPRRKVAGTRRVPSARHRPGSLRRRAW